MTDPKLSDKAMGQAFRELAPSVDIAAVTRIHDRAREIDRAAAAAGNAKPARESCVVCGHWNNAGERCGTCGSNP
jgi:hypothetical protein